MVGKSCCCGPVQLIEILDVIWDYRNKLYFTGFRYAAGKRCRALSVFSWQASVVSCSSLPWKPKVCLQFGNVKIVCEDGGL